MTFRRWENGTPIGYTKLVPDFRENFGASYYVVHRADFHSSLHQRALQLGVNVKVNSRVVSYDVQAPSVTLTTGESFSADLIIAADGQFQHVTSLIFSIMLIKSRSKIRCPHFGLK